MQPYKNYACPTNALWAIKQGQHIGRNIARKFKCKSIKPFLYRGLGQAASLGDFRGIAELYGVQMTGILAKLNRLGFFLYYMPSKRNAIKVLFELCLNSVAGNKLPLNNDIERSLLQNEKHTSVDSSIVDGYRNISAVNSIDTLIDTPIDAIKRESAHA